MSSLDSAHTFKFTLNGADITFYVDPGSVQMTDAEGSEIDTLYFELTDAAGTLSVSALAEATWIIDPGEESELAYFGGLVVAASNVTLPGGGLLWQVKCEGYATLLATMETPEQVYVQKYPGDIVASLLDLAGLTSQDSELGELMFFTDDGLELLEDDAQDWTEWTTISGDAAYAVVVRNADGTITWAFIGDLFKSDTTTIAVYQNRALSRTGWNGADPGTPISYHVRRADALSISRPLDVITHVTTGAEYVVGFATTREEKLNSALSRLALDMGWVWRVDADGYLHFGLASSDPAPFGVSDGDNADYSTLYPALGGSLTVQHSATELFNRVVVRGGAKQSELTTDTFGLIPHIGGMYQLTHRNLIDITIMLNGVVVADGTLWWNTFGDRVVLVHYGEGWIWFDDPPGLGDEVICSYRYWEPLVYEQRDEASIEATGQTLTRTVTDSRIWDEETAQVRATALLAAAADTATSGSFEVWRLGLRAGQEATLLFDAAGIDGEYVIRKVDCRIDQANQGLLCFVQFGGRTATLSAVTEQWQWKNMDIRLGSIAEMTQRSTQFPAKSATASLSLTKHDRVTKVDAALGNVTLTLPEAAILAEQTLVVVRVDASGNTVTVAAASGETINEASTLTVTGAWTAATLYSDGAQWIAHLAGVSPGVTDHGALTGLGDDDHSQYLLATGARTGASSQAQTFTNGIIGPTWKPASDSTTAIRIQNAAGSIDALKVDTSGNAVFFVSTYVTYTEVAGVQAVTFYPNYSGDNAIYSDYWSGSSAIPIAIGAWPFAKALRVTPTARVGIGGGTSGVTPATTLHVLLSSDATNAVTNVVTIGHNTSGTAAAGFGAGLVFQMQSSTTAAQSAGRMTFSWLDPTHATLSAKGQLTAYYTSTERPAITWGANSTVALLSFYDVTTPIARQVLATGAGATADNIITALQALGLVKQS